jgi:hypothetical protein
MLGWDVDWSDMAPMCLLPCPALPCFFSCNDGSSSFVGTPQRLFTVRDGLAITGQHV